MTSSNKGLPPGATTQMIPYLTVRDAEKTRDFYQQAFGFEPTEQVPDEKGKLVHVGMNYAGQGVVMFSPEGAEPITGLAPMESPASSGKRAPVMLYLYCSDVDAMVAQAQKAGAKLLEEAKDMFWGDRIARLQDPDLYEWTFATHTGKIDESQMPSS